MADEICLFWQPLARYVRAAGMLFFCERVIALDKRLGFVGIVIDDRRMAAKVNMILSEYGEMIKGRIGIPDHQSGQSVIGVIVEGTNEALGAMTGKLGNLSGVTVKSAVTSKKSIKEEQGI